MTDRKQRGLNLPPWAVSLSATLLIGLLSFAIGASASSQKVKDDIVVNMQNIEKNAEDITEHEIEVNENLNNKASKEKVDLVYEAVLRLEEKVDGFIKDH